MKVQELRIGNLVYLGYILKTPQDNHLENSMMVYKITPAYIHVLDINGRELSAHYREVIGIRITEQWLEKLGFKESEDFGKYELKKIPDIAYHVKSKTLSIANKYARTNVTKVHELQNIFYSLIGEELL